MVRKFILRVLLLIIPLTTFILFVNIKVDGGFVINERSDEIAKILVSGKNAGVKYIPSSFGGLQIAVVEQRAKLKDVEAPAILVFGTSRSSEINSKIFTNKTFFNCAVPNGNILDYVALYHLYKRHNLLSQYLIISLDPWTFHSRKSVTVDKEINYVADTSTPLKVNSELANEYHQGIKSIGFDDRIAHPSPTKSLSMDNMIELFSPNYFQLNLRSLTSKIVIATDSLKVESYFIIRSDGSYSLTEESKIDSTVVKEKTERFISVQKAGFFDASDTASINWVYFKKLLLSLKNDGVIPIVYISPVNPIVYDALSNHSKVELEEKTNEFCKANNIVRIGSFNPHELGYHTLSNYFMDPYHPAKSVVENLFYMRKHELNAIGITTAQ